MNRLLRTLLLTLIITLAVGTAKVVAQSPNPTVYYWIGGSGNWNDPTHWSAESGGDPIDLTEYETPFPPLIPDATKDVVFDNLSFPPATTIYTVTIDADAQCANFRWTDVPGVTPVLQGNSNLTLKVYGNLIIEAAINNRFEGVVEFLTSGNAIINAASPFHSRSTLRFNNPTGIWTLQENLSANNIQIINGELNANEKTIVVRGDWIVENGGAFKSNKGTVAFRGTASIPQIIRTHNIENSHEFYNLDIENSGGGIELQSPVTVGLNNSGKISFFNGIVKNTSTNILILNNRTQVSGASNISHVNGYVRKYGGDGDDEFDFPIGDGTNYRPAGLVFPNTNPDPNTIFTASYINREATGNTNYTPQNVTDPLTVSQYEYWDVTRESGSANPAIRLSWKIPVSGPIGYLGDDSEAEQLVVASWNPDGEGIWENWGGTDHNVRNANPAAYAGEVESTGTINTVRTIWTIGSLVIPLPIDLLYFRAKLEEQVVQLYWVTAQEVNNDYFTVEKSSDGKSFSILLEVPGAGNSQALKQYHITDANPYSSVSYYRLKQTDLDGKFTYSKIVAVHSSEEFLQLQAYQLSGGAIQVNYTFASAQQARLSVYDSQGRLLWSQRVEAGSDQQQIDLQSARGMHLITLQSNGEIIVRKIVVY